jgi:transposase-like protein
MKRKKHRPEQIIKKLHEADVMLAAGKTIGQVAQTLEISEQTVHRWRNQYGGMKAEEAKRLPAACPLDSTVHLHSQRKGEQASRLSL